MKLRGTEFGNVLGASGVQGFFGEGYWYHRDLEPLGLDFRDVTFVSKTTTLHPNKGNLPLMKDFQPKEWFPACIYVNFLRGYALNSVALSGPGAMALFETGLWQARQKPFFISFMSIAASAEERTTELKGFVELFAKYLPGMSAKVGLQINYSCPNTGLHLETLLEEVNDGLNIASELDIPLVPKFNLLMPIETAKEISERKFCDALCISNTIPYGQLPEKIDWQKLFGSKSPLAKYGGGGLSGKLLLPLLLSWLDKAHYADIRKPINAGGGILSLEDAKMVFVHGADSIFLGSIAFLRPWRVAKIARVLK